METFLVTFLCSQLSIMAGPQYNTACTNFTNATFIQTGIHNDISGLQHDAEKLGVKEQHSIEETTGETPWKVATVLYAGGTIARSGNLQYTTNIRPIANTLSINLNQQSQNVTLSWQF
jgi:hypothetical protein